MTIYICSPFGGEACGYTYPDCPKEIYMSDGLSMPCPTLSEYLEMFGEQSDDDLLAMSYEVGITFKKMKKYYLVARKKVDGDTFDLQVQRN